MFIWNNYTNTQTHTLTHISPPHNILRAEFVFTYAINILKVN